MRLFRKEIRDDMPLQARPDCHAGGYDRPWRYAPVLGVSNARADGFDGEQRLAAEFAAE